MGYPTPSPRAQGPCNPFIGQVDCRLMLSSPPPASQECLWPSAPGKGMVCAPWIWAFWKAAWAAWAAWAAECVRTTERDGASPWGRSSSAESQFRLQEIPQRHREDALLGHCLEPPWGPKRTLKFGTPFPNSGVAAHLLVATEDKFGAVVAWHLSCGICFGTSSARGSS